MVISQNTVIVNFLVILETFQAGTMAFLTSIHCCPDAKYLFPNRFIYGAMLSLWTQRLINIHDIKSLPFIPSIHHWLQRLDRGVLVKHCSVEPKDGSSSPRIANKLLPYLWILDNLFGGRKQNRCPDAILFIPLQFRTPVRTHLHTANQRPRVLICIQPIHRGWFSPRYKLVRPPFLPSTARGAVGKATCSTALHCLFSGCEFKSSCWHFCCCYNKMGNNGVYSVRGDTQMMK